MEKHKINFSKIFDQLFPLNRSLLGSGYKKSLEIMSKFIPFNKIRYKSGKKVFDWVVPKEWVIREGFIKYKGKKILDYKKNNLHVLSYSDKVNKILDLKQLKKRIFSLPKKPKFIPYVTSYYNRTWGFCMSFNQKKGLNTGRYHCVVDSYFKQGELINGFTQIKGKSKKIILISTYLCHPSLANNELSGPLTMIGLYNKIKSWKHKNFTYIFLINPETIGSLCFLHSYGKKLKKLLDSGLVLTCLGGPQKKLSYKLSKTGKSTLDKLFIFLNQNKKILLREFDPSEGSDERQYNSPGFNLPIGNISRTVYEKYDRYHNSGDDKKFMNISMIEKSVIQLSKILEINDYLLPIKRVMPYGELMLSKRNLYSTINFQDKGKDINNFKIVDKKILLNILNYADGSLNILEISKLRKLNFDKAIEVLKICLEKKLVKFL